MDKVQNNQTVQNGEPTDLDCLLTLPRMYWGAFESFMSIKQTDSDLKRNIANFWIMFVHVLAVYKSKEQIMSLEKKTVDAAILISVSSILISYAMAKQSISKQETKEITQVASSKTSELELYVCESATEEVSTDCETIVEKEQIVLPSHKDENGNTLSQFTTTLNEMKNRASRNFNFSCVQAEQSFVCSQVMENSLSQLEGWQLNYHEAETKEFYCLRAFSTSKLQGEVASEVAKDEGDKMSSGLYAHENSLNFVPNRAIQFFSSMADEKTAPAVGKQDSYGELNDGDDQPENIERVDLDKLARISITNQELNGHFDYVIFTKIQFFDVNNNLMATLKTHNEDYIKQQIASQQLKKGKKHSYEEELDCLSERVVGIKIGSNKTGIPCSIQFLITSFLEDN